MIKLKWMGLRCTKRSRASCSQNSAQRADISFFAKIFWSPEGFRWKGGAAFNNAVIAKIFFGSTLHQGFFFFIKSVIGTLLLRTTSCVYINRFSSLCKSFQNQANLSCTLIWLHPSMWNGVNYKSGCFNVRCLIYNFQGFKRKRTERCWTGFIQWDGRNKEIVSILKVNK